MALGTNERVIRNERHAAFLARLATAEPFVLTPSLVIGPIVVVAVVALVALLLFVAFRGRGGATLGALHAERLHDWEKGLSEAHEEALLHGVEAFRDRGHDLLLHHEGAKLDVLEPPMVVSLYALTDAFSRRGSTETAVGELLDEWSREPAPGAALHLARTPEVGKIAARVQSAIDPARAEITGIENARVDELRGTLELTLRVDGAPNTLVVDLARATAEIQRKQDAGDETPWNDLVRAELRSAVMRDRDGVLWMRTPSADERATAVRIVDR